MLWNIDIITYEEIGEKIVKKGTDFEMFYKTLFCDGKDIILLPTDEYLSKGDTRCTVVIAEHYKIAFVSSCDLKRFENKTNEWVYPTKKSILFLHPLRGSKVYFLAHMKKKTENQGIDCEKALDVVKENVPEINRWLDWIFDVIDGKSATA